MTDEIPSDSYQCRCINPYYEFEVGRIYSYELLQDTELPIRYVVESTIFEQEVFDVLFKELETD